MKIYVHDDGKCKHQSFTASVNLELVDPFDTVIEAYGSDSKEATTNLLKDIGIIANGINEKYDSLLKEHKDFSYEGWLDFKVRNKAHAERTVRWLIKEYDIKLD